MKSRKRRKGEQDVVETELDSESLKYIIDIGRPTKSVKEILTEMDNNIKVHVKGVQKNFDWLDGLDN